MPIYQIDRDITDASGTQTYKVSADNMKEARKKFENGEGEFVDEDVNIDSISDIDECNIYEI